MSLETRQPYLIGSRAKTVPGPLWRMGLEQADDLVAGRDGFAEKDATLGLPDDPPAGDSGATQLSMAQPSGRPPPPTLSKPDRDRSASLGRTALWTTTPRDAPGQRPRRPGPHALDPYDRVSRQPKDWEIRHMRRSNIRSDVTRRKNSIGRAAAPVG